MKLLLLLSASLYAAPTISNIAVSNITGYGVRIEWDTNVAATDNAITYSTTPGATPTTSCATPFAAGLSCATLQNTASTAHGWFIAGLAPSTTYYYKVRSTASGETYSSEGNFTTTTAETGTVTAPTAPTAASYSEPSSFTTTYTVAAGCTDLQAVLTTAAAQDGNNNYRINIPSGERCVGKYTLPAKSGVNPSGTGYLLLTTDATIPPSGARIDSTMLTNVPRIISNELAVEYYQTTTPGSCTSPGEGWLDSDSTDPNAFLYWCTATVPTWTAVAMSSGTSVPSSCTPSSSGPYFYDTDEATVNSRVSVCQPDGKYLTLYIENTNQSTAFPALRAAASAARWYVRGLRLERPFLPTSYTNLLPTATGNGDQYPAAHRCLLYTVTTNDRIIVDRVYFDAYGWPMRMRDSICFFQGTNIAIINSYFNETNYWRPTGSLENTPNTIFMSESGGPFQIENNYFKNAHGITIFGSDDVASGMMSDGTIRRNTFYENPADNCSGIASNGRCYFRRHMIEFKRVSKILIEGNHLNGGWPAAVQGASIALTPRAGASASNVGILDINMKSNLFTYAAQPLLLTGHNDYPTYQTLATNRIAMTNNVFYSNGMASDGSTQGWPNGSYLNGQTLDTGLGLQNFNFSNNAIILPKSACCNANMMSHSVDWMPYLNSRLKAESNIFTVLDGTNTGGQWGVMAWTYQGTTALNNSWLSGGAASYSVTGNAMQLLYAWDGGPVDSSTYPAGNYRNATASNFTNALYQYGSDAAKFRPLAAGIMASGSSTARGSDQRDNGPDYDVYDVAQGATRNLRALSITSSGAVVHFTSPDATACTVEVGTSSTPGTGTRFASAGGSRFQSATITGLAGATLHYYRVYGGGCPIMASGSFTTS